MFCDSSGIAGSNGVLVGNIELISKILADVSGYPSIQRLVISQPRYHRFVRVSDISITVQRNSNMSSFGLRRTELRDD
jgi:hypothetical protein